MNTCIIWSALFPDQPWPGDDAEVKAMADEIRSLRTLTDNVVTRALNEQEQMRSRDEIQRAHDIVGRYCTETNDAETFAQVSALCWVLRHGNDGNFAKSLQAVEERLERLGIEVIRLPTLVNPGQEGETDDLG
jgi:hypothetical protein